VTREPFPRFDLYGELEVSPLASVEAIEAAYRSLVKRHHPDVAGSADDERMVRLNLAREWLTDPDRRSRYDASRARATVSAMMRPREGAGTGATASGSNTEAPAPTFGVNAAQVRHFLGELRGLDSYRARQVWDGRAVAHARGYTRARRAAMAVGRAKRHDEWLFAREAASVIARGELGDSVLTDQVLDVVADIAGAIAVRDLLPRIEFDVLYVPWTWRGEPVTGRASAQTPTPEALPAATPVVSVAKPSSTPATPAASTLAPTSAPNSPPIAPAPSPVSSSVAATTAQSVPVDPRPTFTDPSIPAVERMQATVPTPEVDQIRSRVASIGASVASTTRRAGASTAATLHSRLRPAFAPRRRVPRSTLWPAVGALVALVAAGGLLVALLRPSSNQAVAGITDAPRTLTAIDGLGIPSPTTSAVGGSQPFQTSQPGGGATGPTVGPGSGQTPAPGPGATPAHGPGPTPSPTATLQSTPPPGPTPKPTVSPSPSPMCTVPILVGQRTHDARRIWDAALFTGAVTFSPAVPPPYVIVWQSLTAGSSAPCSSGITVSDAAP
jgi:DnaJ domain